MAPVPELDRTVMDIGRGHGELGGRKQGSRAWGKQASLSDHGSIVSSVAGDEAIGRRLHHGLTQIKTRKATMD